uniref:hypothetical protein n=2 Tax=Enterocloster clostridioformis TaxID=1531 RepID=UPI000A99C21C|nr:hypothetical protein [Enterocloster clostridioformis]
MDRFLEQFQNPQAVEDDGHVVEGLFNFYFFMDQKAWSHAWIQGIQVGLRVKKLYGVKRDKWFRVMEIMAALCGLCIGIILNNTTLTAVFLTLLLLSYMRDHGEMDAFLNFCRDRGVKWSGVDKTEVLLKNDRMLYILIALVLLAVLISSIIRAVCL